MRLLLTLAVAVALLISGPAQTVAQESGSVAFATDESLDVSLSHSERSKDVVVSVHNGTNAAVVVGFCVLVEGKVAATCDDGAFRVTVPLEQATIAPGDVNALTLSVALGDDAADLPIDDVSGRLAMRSLDAATLGAAVSDAAALDAAMQDAPVVAVRPLKVTQAKQSMVGQFLAAVKGPLAKTIVFGAAILAALWGLAISTRKPRGAEWKWEAPHIGDSPLNFSNSYATTLTTLGAISGTVLSSSILPGDTALVPKNTLVGLNLFFLALIVLAPFVYNAKKKAEVTEPGSGGEPPKKHFEGHIKLYGASIYITLFAVFGELLTLGVVIEEIYQHGAMPRFAVTLFFVLLAVITGLVLIYSWTQVKYRATNQTKTRQVTSAETGVTTQESYDVPPPEYSAL